jgi:hypothetical protein
MTASEQQAIKDAYTGPDGQFHYEKLEEDINDVPPAGFYETHPEAIPAEQSPFHKFGLSGTVAALPSALRPMATLNDKDTAEVQRIVAQAQYESHSRGISLLQYIRQYDKAHSGLVTKSQFIREFVTCFKTIILEDVGLLAKAYANADGTSVMYMAVCRDITPDIYHSHRDEKHVPQVNNFEVATLPSSHIHLQAGKRAPSPNARLDRTLAAGSGGDAVKHLLTAVIRHVYERRINITNIFSDFDKRGRHRITRPQFVRAVASLGLESVSPADLEALANAYTDEADPAGNLVIYRRFLEEVNSSFFLPGLEKEPLKLNNTFAHAVVNSAPPRDTRAALTVAEDHQLQIALGFIKGSITRLRAYNAGAAMRDFDVLGEGYITIERFLRALAIFSLVPETQPERAALLKFYGGTGMRERMINYRAFLKDVSLE